MYTQFNRKKKKNTKLYGKESPENENKIKLRDFNCIRDKMDRDDGNKRKDFIDVILTMPCQNSSWIMSLRIYGERRTQIAEFNHYDSSSGTRSRINGVHTDIKIAKNTKKTSHNGIFY